MPLRHLRKVHDFHGVGVDGDGPGHGGGRPVLGAEAGGVRALAEESLLPSPGHSSFPSLRPLICQCESLPLNFTASINIKLK